MNKLEKELAKKTLKAIGEDKKEKVEEYYQKYLFYTRNELKDFNEDLQNEVMFRYAEYVTKDVK